mgnify:CR=1 FL=1
MKKWSLNSWTKLPAKHLPVYQDKEELDLVLSKIKKYPPLVFAGETRSLKKSLAMDTAWATPKGCSWTIIEIFNLFPNSFLKTAYLKGINDSGIDSISDINNLICEFAMET